MAQPTPSPYDPGQPPQGGYPPAGPGTPAAPGIPDPAPKRSWFARHTILTGLGAVVLVAIIASALGGRGSDEPAAAGTGSQTSSASSSADDTSSSADASESSEPPAAATIGTPVRDGRFEFTVTSVEPGIEHLGTDAFGVDAQGQFLLVHLTVANIGDQAQYFDGSSQKLTDTEGRTHSADGAAAIYLDDSHSFLNQINPGNTVEGIVVFDIPEDAVPASIELHDSAWSGGVSVTLG